MAVSASGQGGLLVRVDPPKPTASSPERTERFEIRGRPMNGWLRVDPPVFAPNGSSSPGSAWRDLRAVAPAEALNSHVR